MFSNRGKPKPEDKKDKLTLSWSTWKADPSPTNMTDMMKQVNPVVDKAVYTYAPQSSPAVRSIAKVYTRKALESYDPTKGTKLQTHLHIQLQPLRREAASYNTLHVPENVRTDMRQLGNAERQYEMEQGRSANDDELADYTSLSRARINHIRKFYRPTVYDSAISEGGEGGAEQATPALSDAESLWEDYVYYELSDKDKLIYDMKLGNKSGKPASLADISAKMKMTPSAISQRLKRIAEKIMEGEQYAKASR